MKFKNQIERLEDVLYRMRLITVTYQAKIESRKAFYLRNKVSWQDSEKGDNHQTQTDEMENLYNNVQLEFTSIETSIEKLKKLTN